MYRRHVAGQSYSQAEPSVTPYAAVLQANEYATAPLTVPAGSTMLGSYGVVVGPSGTRRNYWITIDDQLWLSWRLCRS